MDGSNWSKKRKWGAEKIKDKNKKNSIFRNILIIKNIKLLLLKYNNLQFILLIENERNNIFFKILK